MAEMDKAPLVELRDIRVSFGGVHAVENVTVADVSKGKLPKDIIALTRHEEAWETR